MLQLAAKPLVEASKASLRMAVHEFARKRGRPPKLVVVLIGDDPASVIYTRKKGDTAADLGMAHENLSFQADSSPTKVRDEIHRLNQDPSVDGILVQRPLPKQFTETEALQWVSPSKDVDAFHPENVGRLVLGLPCLPPCTPSGIMDLLRHYRIELEGKVACIVGRSSIVGKPMATLLLQANATVLHCHSRTRDLPSVTRLADLLIVAAGKPALIGASDVRPGATVVDVGIHRSSNGTLMGDVRFDEVSRVASAITPVPGGVGPMTIVKLMENTLRAAEMRLA